MKSNQKQTLFYVFVIILDVVNLLTGKYMWLKILDVVGLAAAIYLIVSNTKE